MIKGKTEGSKREGIYMDREGRENDGGTKGKKEARKKGWTWIEGRVVDLFYSSVAGYIIIFSLDKQNPKFPPFPTVNSSNSFFPPCQVTLSYLPLAFLFYQLSSFSCQSESHTSFTHL